MKKSSSSTSKKRTKPKVKKDDLKHISGGVSLKDVLKPPENKDNPPDSDEIGRLIRQGII
ncbi:hypothetical protein [Legionella jamestowniensis]|uniref:Uncharacterized protein n=1 Tax=Legionella jamestowniensis TaxID=455 RepID=A0A0W0UGN9_9GAMM|nr:hypothetical protein [Legionella jamestowniensis]KTD07061.1 hypothetical protein Ljam_1256 [Legionella jamestowniensis]OCH97642.1 hypothetical protein A8135_13610 [Legionella jamestowniensis]SFM03075.1 hypothetical protein SAMN02746073_0024 [Legionella jamestowniensis DSM 19215]